MNKEQRKKTLAFYFVFVGNVYTFNAETQKPADAFSIEKSFQCSATLMDRFGCRHFYPAVVYFSSVWQTFTERMGTQPFEPSGVDPYGSSVSPAYAGILFDRQRTTQHNHAGISHHLGSALPSSFLNISLSFQQCKKGHAPCGHWHGHFF
jgi:hypothetical protein